MERFIRHFGDMGPRWGLDADTCRVHAYLYLAGRPAAPAEIAAGLGLAATAVERALADLAQWGMARPAPGVGWDGSGEPWDLLFAALEERRRRELQPALDMLHACRDDAAKDGATPPPVRQRIARLLQLVEDLAAIDLQSRRLSPGSVARLVNLGGRAARLIDRIFPAPPDRSSR
jgi:DNA-binding transcriptional regulator GbsR (MarR family)